MRISYILLVIALALGSKQTNSQNLVGTKNIEQLAIRLQSNAVQPLFDVNNNRLYFVCGDNTQGDSSNTDQNIYYVDRTQNGWSSIQNEGLEEINDDYNNGVVGISSSGDTLYLIGNYKGKGEKRKGLSMAVRSKEGRFRLIDETIKIQKFNPLGSFYGYYMHPKGEHLFISMSTRGDHGIDNLYYAEKVDDFSYGEPKKIDALNTDELEFAPYITEDLETIYFTRSDSTGNFSIYSSNRSSGDSFLNWSTPTIVNEINTQDFEGFFSIYNDEFFFVSDRDTTFTTIYTNPYQGLPELDQLLAADESGIDSSKVAGIEENIESNDTTEVPQFADLNASETESNAVSNTDDENGSNSGVNQSVNPSSKAAAAVIAGVALAEDESGIDSSKVAGIEENVESNDTTEVPQLADLNASETESNAVSNANDENGSNSGVNQSVNPSSKAAAAVIAGVALAADESGIDSSKVAGIEENVESNDTTEVPQLAELNASETESNAVSNTDDENGSNRGVNQSVNPSSKSAAAVVAGVSLAAGGKDEIGEERNSVEAVVHNADQKEGSGPKPVTRTYIIDHFEFNVVYAPENELLRVLDSLDQFSELSSISIVGHADMIGSSGINIKIGNQRAKTTRWWLTRFGHFDLRLFTVRSLGESKPVKTGESTADRAFNRRVEITVTGYLK